MTKIFWNVGILLSKKLKQVALERDRVDQETTLGWVWSLERWIFACVLTKKLRKAWRLSCKSVGYTISTDDLNVSSW